MRPRVQSLRTAAMRYARFLLLGLSALVTAPLLLGGVGASPSAVTLVSVGSAGNGVAGESPAISHDGRFVTFSAYAPDVVRDGANGVDDSRGWASRHPRSPSLDRVPV